MSTILDATDAMRLLMCMQLGIVIQHADGHRYVTASGTDDHPGELAPGVVDTLPLNRQLRDAGLESIRPKQYGSLRNCLDIIDGALRELGQPDLRTLFDAGGDRVWGFER